MEMRVTIPLDGTVTIETISILEDLWHDYEFFKERARAAEALTATAAQQLLAKRYCRAAFLMLVFYLEGVVNRWLSDLLPASEWRAIERRPLRKKIERVEAQLSRGPRRAAIRDAKRLRDRLAHLKPAGDLELYDRITSDFLTNTERCIVTWVAEVEEIAALSRHPDTREVSRPLREALGGVSSPEAEAYSGQLPTDI